MPKTYHPMTAGEDGNTPAAMKKVPAYRTIGLVAAKSITYPIIARQQPPSIIGPRALILSDKVEQIKTMRKAPILGGTVKSCAVTRV